MAIHHVFYGLHNPSRYAKQFIKYELNFRKLPFNSDVRVHNDGNALASQAEFVQHIYDTLQSARAEQPDELHTATIIMDYNYGQSGGFHVIDKFDPQLINLGFKRHADFFDPRKISSADRNFFHFNYIFDGAQTNSKDEALTQYANGKLSEVIGGFRAFQAYVLNLTRAKSAPSSNAVLSSATQQLGAGGLAQALPKTKTAIAVKINQPVLTRRQTEPTGTFPRDLNPGNSITILPSSSNSPLSIVVEDDDETSIDDACHRRVISDGIVSVTPQAPSSYMGLSIFVEDNDGVETPYKSSTASITNMLPEAPRFAYQQMSVDNLKDDGLINSHSSTRVDPSPVTASPATASPIGATPVTPMSRAISAQGKAKRYGRLEFTGTNLIKQLEDAATLRDAICKIDLKVDAEGIVSSSVSYKS